MSSFKLCLSLIDTFKKDNTAPTLPFFLCYYEYLLQTLVWLVSAFPHVAALPGVFAKSSSQKTRWSLSGIYRIWYNPKYNLKNVF